MASSPPLQSPKRGRAHPDGFAPDPCSIDSSGQRRATTSLVVCHFFPTHPSQVIDACQFDGINRTCLFTHTAVNAAKFVDHKSGWILVSVRPLGSSLGAAAASIVMHFAGQAVWQRSRRRISRVPDRPCLTDGRPVVFRNVRLDFWVLSSLILSNIRLTVVAIPEAMAGR